MKTKLTLLACALIGALLAGCATASKLNDIRVGMTKSDVIAILGTPDSTSAQANVEYLTYYLAADNGSYGREAAYVDQPYMVRLVDGKVESFGREFQLFDLYNRPVTNARPGSPNFPAPGVGSALVGQPANPTDIASQLERLKALKDQGVLTDDEFQKAKEQVLSGQK
jgi:Short C-terminal domain/SmpA / OmlA family